MHQRWARLAALPIVALLLSCAGLDGDGPTQKAPAPAATAPVKAATGSETPRATPGATGAAGTATPGGGGTPTPAPATTGAPAAATPGAGAPTPSLGTPPAQPPAASGYRRHVSSLYPYALDYPQSWQAITGGATSGEAQADLFAGEQHGKALSSVTVYSQPVADGTSSRLFADAVLAELVGAGISPEAEQARTVAGSEGFVFAYRTAREDQSYAVTQVVFVRAVRAWVITLTSAPEAADALRPVFEHMLASFQTWE